MLRDLRLRTLAYIHSTAISQTNAFPANHSCCTRQCAQWVLLKNTEIVRNALYSMYLPVEVARPVAGQRIISMSIRRVPRLCHDGRSARVRRDDNSYVTIQRF